MELHWKICVFGQLRAQCDDQTVPFDTLRQARSLLATVAIAKGMEGSIANFQRFEQIKTNIWPYPDRPDKSSTIPPNRLDKLISSLNKHIHQHLQTPPSRPVIISMGTGQDRILSLGQDFTTDIGEFREGIAKGERIEDPDDRIRRLIEALQLCDAPLLGGNKDGSPWLADAEDDVARTFSRGLSSIVDTLNRFGQEIERVGLAELALQAACAAYGFLHHAFKFKEANEKFHALLITLYSWIDTSQGMFERCPQLQSFLNERLESYHADPAMQVWRSPRIAGFGLLPRIVDRVQEIDDIFTLFLSTDPFVTLTGGSGTGKTRIAQQVAWTVGNSIAQAVWFVPLEDVATREEVLVKIAAELGLSMPEGSNIDQIITRLSRQRSLLILDTLEHLLSDSVHISEVIENLLRHLPRLRCLCTAQGPTGSLFERRYPISVFPTQRLPTTLHKLSNFACVQMFEAVARASWPSFAITEQNAATVAKLCEVLDGLPLAIKLVAAWAGVRTPQEMLKGLNDLKSDDTTAKRLKERHSSLTASLEWSYKLIPDEQRPFLEALSVFRGGWSSEAVAQICTGDGLSAGDGLSEWEATRRLEKFWNRSLVQPETTGEQTRYRLITPMQDYLWEEKLDGGQRQELSRQHLKYFVALAERGRNYQVHHNEAEWFALMEADHANIIAALQRCDPNHSEHTGLALRLVSALARFWIVRGYLREARQWLSRCTAWPHAIKFPEERAGALIGLASAARLQNDADAAVAAYTDASITAEASGNVDRMARCFNGIGIVYLSLGKSSEAGRWFQKALSLPPGSLGFDTRATVLENAGIVLAQQEIFEQADAHFAAAYAIWDHPERRNPVALGRLLFNRGELAMDQSDTEAALSLYRQSLRIRYDEGHREGTAYSLDGIAGALCSSHQNELISRAVVLWAAADSLRKKHEISDPIEEVDGKPILRPRTKLFQQAKQSLGPDKYSVAWAAGKAMVDELRTVVTLALEV